MEESETGDNKKVSSMLKVNIVEQIEYYFGDFNLMKDKFLKFEITKDEGWIPIRTLLNFNRLAALSKDVNVIMDAFKENPSELVELDETRQCIRRNPQREIPEQNEAWRNAVAERSVYIKGFSSDITTLDDILKFLQAFGKIDNVFKRCHYDKALKQWKFKGSVYVAFPTREDAARFMDIGSVKYNGQELIRKWQTDYVTEKKQERIQNKLKEKETKTKLLQEQVKADMKSESKKLPTGALIKLDGLPSDVKVSQLKNHLISVHGWNIGYIEHNEGESIAYVRLQEQDSAKEALAKLKDSAFEFNDITYKAELVEGEKETELLQKMEADRNLRMMNILMKHKNKRAKGKNRKNYKGDRNGEIAKQSNDAEKKNEPKVKPATNVKEQNVEQKNSVNEQTVKQENNEAGDRTNSKMEVVKMESKDNDGSNDASCSNGNVPSLKRKPEVHAKNADAEIKKPKQEPKNE